MEYRSIFKELLNLKVDPKTIKNTGLEKIVAFNDLSLNQSIYGIVNSFVDRFGDKAFSTVVKLTQRNGKVLYVFLHKEDENIIIYSVYLELTSVGNTLYENYSLTKDDNVDRFIDWIKKNESNKMVKLIANKLKLTNQLTFNIEQIKNSLCYSIGFEANRDYKKMKLKNPGELLSKVTWILKKILKKDELYHFSGYKEDQSSEGASSRTKWYLRIIKSFIKPDNILNLGDDTFFIKS